MSNLVMQMVAFIIVSSWTLIILTSLYAIGSTLYMSSKGREVPDIQQKIAMAAMGFLFGSIPALVKDLLTMVTP